MEAPKTVGELEQALFEAFPREDAEDWDQPGLSVGDRDALVGKVALNLDQSVGAVLAAAEAGCNVLVTHHPPFIKGGPTEFGPESQITTSGPGRMVFEAARLGVNVIAMHTNADRAIATRHVFAERLGCLCAGNFEYLINPERTSEGTGLGAVLTPDWNTTPTLELVARMCKKTLGGAPRVWGAPERTVRRIAYLNGSWSEPEIYETCVREGIDCVIVGETRYHGCVDAQPYLSVIELGHDRSELPIVDVLHDTLIKRGIEEDAIVELPISAENWWSPETEL